MNLLQVKIDNNLKKAIDEKARTYGVPASSLIRIVLVKSFLLKTKKRSNDDNNIFDAERDNNGKGIHIDDLIAAL